MPGTALQTEHALKHARLMQLVHDLGGDAVVLSTPASLSWYLGGTRTHVSLAGAPIARVVVHAAGCDIATSISEAGRLCSEELTGLDSARLHVLDWHASLDEISAWFTAPEGFTVLDETSLEPQLRALRTRLCPAEIQRYRQLCADTARVFTDVLSQARASDSEHLLASKLVAGATAQGGEVLVALVSGESRAAHRHPLPTDASLGRRAMAVLCVRRHGLIANVTRWIRFGAPLPGEEQGDADILAVEADILAGITLGSTLGSLLPTVQQAYPDHGFDSQEWSNHHQGGLAGYNGRDPRLSPGAPDVFQQDQAFAFNPSAVRDSLTYKVEDTMLLTHDGEHQRIEVLSVDPRWPSVNINGLPRPQVLQLPGD